MRIYKQTAVALSVCTAVVATASPATAFDRAGAQSPFAMEDLGSGYMLGDEHEGKCGEGKCGGEKKEEAEGKCGEGKCGGQK